MHQEELLSRVAAAVTGQPVRVLLSLAGALSPTQVDVPDSVVVRSWVDFDEVLPLTRLLVTHGGMATTTAALLHGVPMLVIPQSRDQHLNGQRVSDGGCGLVLPPGSSDIEIQTAIRLLLADDTYRAAAEQFGASLRRLRSGRLAVERLERLLVAGPA